MRIAVLHRYPASEVVGTNASFISFLEELKRQGHQVFYVTYKDSQKSEKIRGILYRELPFYFQRGKRRDKLLKTLLWIFLAPLKSWQIKIKDRADLFYCDDSVPYYGFLTKLLVGKTKVVIRLGDLQSGYNFADQGFLKDILFKFALALERSMWRRIDGIVAISKSFAEFIKKQGLPEEKIKLIEESIDLEKFKFAPEQKESLPLQPTIMFHGALLPCKGLETLIKSIPLVLEKIPKASFIIAGGGPEEKRIKNLAEKLSLKEKILFTGWYNHEKLPAMMRGINIGVVMRSSNMANNFVVTTCLLEYWASKKPVIVPKLEAMKGVVKDGFNGFFFTPDDEKDLAQKIIYLSQNRFLWKALGENGRKTAQKYFDKDLIAQKMVYALKELS